MVNHVQDHPGTLSVFMKYTGTQEVSGLCAESLDEETQMEILEKSSQSETGSICFISDSDNRKKCDLEEAAAVCQTLFEKGNFQECFDALPSKTKALILRTRDFELTFR